MAPLADAFGRPLHDLRISVTDRCNFRCTYCMPKEIFGRDYEFLARELLLSFEEIERVAAAFVRLGTKKIRLTGGEPLLRRGIEDLIARLAALPGVEDLTLTTNGALLERKAAALKAAGLQRVTVSLDSMDDTVFMAMNDVGFPVRAVLDGIEAAAAVGLAPIKVNMVVKRGVNEDSVVEMASHFRGTGHVVRFIEYMDVGTTNGWRLDDVVSGKEIVELINARYPLEPVDPDYRGEVAQRYRYGDGAGEIGVITSVTQPFCGDCTRARLSAEGRLYTCLFASAGTDLRDLIRSGATDEALEGAIAGVWSARTDRYSEIRTSQTVHIGRKVEMSYIGG
ncbi:MAG TPA: GTP 3',8-cyclase MoaA [Acidimicrobiia bacterium]|jgi:cyclic pyranopterin phosphate synthase|nr:GTP 3',8-cyclase MoaA [Acidimicrobiia bacterium]